MRPYARVRKLTEEEYGELKRWERSRTMGVSKVRRAKIVLLSHRGLLVQEIAEKLELHHQSVRKWVNRFSRQGMPGLEEGPRHGRPHIYKTEHVSVVIQTALTKPDTLGLPFGAWTLNRLTAYLSEEKGIAMSRSRMSEIFRNEGLRWRQQEGWFGQRVDPDFAEKRGSLNSSTPTRLNTASSSA
jgi:transposase